MNASYSAAVAPGGAQKQNLIPRNHLTEEIIRLSRTQVGQESVEALSGGSGGFIDAGQTALWIAP